MARQKTVWVTDLGQPASSELDAKLADAGNAIENFVLNLGYDGREDYPDPHTFLMDHHKELLPLLQTYADAVVARNAEVMSDAS